MSVRGYRTTQDAPRRVEREHGLSVVSNAAHPLKDITEVPGGAAQSWDPGNDRVGGKKISRRLVLPMMTRHRHPHVHAHAHVGSWGRARAKLRPRLKNSVPVVITPSARDAARHSVVAVLRWLLC